MGPAFTGRLRYKNHSKLLKTPISTGLTARILARVEFFFLSSLAIKTLAGRINLLPSVLSSSSKNAFKARVFPPLIFRIRTFKYRNPHIYFFSSEEKMEKPKFPPSGPSLPGREKEGSGASAKNFLKKPPTPEELISYYEAQGMESKEAAMKVIQDLQGILFKVVGSKTKSHKANSPAEVSRKLDTANTRLAILEMKLDTKPSYAQSLALGVAAGATLKGIGSIVPHVAGAIGQIWNAVRSSSNPTP